LRSLLIWRLNRDNAGGVPSASDFFEDAILPVAKWISIKGSSWTNTYFSLAYSTAYLIDGGNRDNTWL